MLNIQFISNEQIHTTALNSTLFDKISDNNTAVFRLLISDLLDLLDPAIPSDLYFFSSIRSRISA